MFEKMYPYTNYSEYNLDWIIAEIRKVHKDWSEFKILNTIRFEGLWDITKQYPAWSLVTDNNNVGYISVQPVPAGINISNTDYWKEVYDYNAILPDIMQRIVDLEHAVDNIDNTEIPAIQNDIGTINNDITTINNTITNTISPRITFLENRKIIIYGDSYVTDVPAGYTGTNFRTFLTNMLADCPNISFDLSADGGERFILGSTNSFSYDVENFVSVFNADEVTDVFFIGGYNDRNSAVSDINTGMQDAFAKVRAKYTKAKISVGHFGWNCALASTERDNILEHSLKGWFNCRSYGAGYMTNAEYTMHNYNNYTGDGVHPDQDGTEEIARQIVNYIFTGSCDVHYPYVHTDFNSTGYPTSSYTNTDYSVGFKLDNDIVSIYLPDRGITYSTGMTLSNTSYERFLQMVTTNKPYKGYAIGINDSNKNKSVTLPIIGYLQQSPAVFLPASECHFIINYGFLQIRPYALNTSHSSFETVSNVLNFHPIGGCVTIPTLMC